MRSFNKSYQRISEQFLSKFMMSWWLRKNLIVICREVPFVPSCLTRVRFIALMLGIRELYYSLKARKEVWKWLLCLMIISLVYPRKNWELSKAMAVFSLFSARKANGLDLIVSGWKRRTLQGSPWVAVSVTVSLIKLASVLSLRSSNWRWNRQTNLLL